MNTLPKTWRTASTLMFLILLSHPIKMYYRHQQASTHNFTLNRNVLPMFWSALAPDLREIQPICHQGRSQNHSTSLCLTRVCNRGRRSKELIEAIRATQQVHWDRARPINSTMAYKVKRREVEITWGSKSPQVWVGKSWMLTIRWLTTSNIIKCKIIAQIASVFGSLSNLRVRWALTSREIVMQIYKVRHHLKIRRMDPKSKA